MVREASSSVMRYSSTAVAVSGSIFAAIAGFKLNADPNGIASVMLLTLANMTLFIHLIINYKCASHNRLAAYRNLIAAERFDEDKIGQINRDEQVDPAVGFDVCMDHLNHTYAEGKFDFTIVRGEFFSRKGVFGKLEGPNDIDLFVSESFSRKVKKFDGPAGDSYGKTRHADNVWRWFAIPILPFLMLGVYKRKGTWSFPDPINRMMVFIVTMELAVAGYFFFKEPITWSCNPMILSGFIALSVVSVILLHTVSVQWQELMIGGKRIFSYFVQFVPFRMIYIKQMFGLQEEDTHIAYFVGTEWELEETQKS